MLIDDMARLKTRLTWLLQGYGWLSFKEASELTFWRRELGIILRWMDGTPHPDGTVSWPLEDGKVMDPDPVVNAMLTWMKVKCPRYPARLGLPADHFRGCRVLDVGCGPIPIALGFTDCDMYGIDPLASGYRRLGFPLDHFIGRMTYLQGSAEKIPVEDSFFDAVISVNALDHVDDFPAAAREIDRVLRPGGKLVFEANVHPPTICEPWHLDEETVRRHFGGRDVQKVLAEPTHGDHEERVVWSNQEPKAAHPA